MKKSCHLTQQWLLLPPPAVDDTITEYMFGKCEVAFQVGVIFPFFTSSQIFTGPSSCIHHKYTVYHYFI